jgi:O-antigen ligase
MAGVLTFALVNGYVSNGHWSSWALVNKYIGFFVLMSYFMFGGWLFTNTPLEKQSEILKQFSKIFCAFTIIVLVAFLLMLSIKLYDTSIPFPFYLPQWAGLMANRNAFMVLVLFVLLCMEIYRINQDALFKPWVYHLFWVLIPVFAVFNGSRAGWLFGALALVIILIKSRSHFVKKITPFLAVGSVFAFSLYKVAQHKKLSMHKQLKNLQNIIGDDVSYAGDQLRLSAMRDSWELFEQSNPLWGAGLGSFANLEISYDFNKLNIVDCSALFLLSEMGILGLAAFSLFFMVALWSLYKAAYQQKHSFHEAVLIFLILIIGISFLHELLYTRFLWFILGLSLAQITFQKGHLIARSKPDKNDSSRMAD